MIGTKMTGTHDGHRHKDGNVDEDKKISVRGNENKIYSNCFHTKSKRITFVIIHVQNYEENHQIYGDYDDEENDLNPRASQLALTDFQVVIFFYGREQSNLQG